MSRYFSRTYRGFLIQQTDTGWIVPMLPNWSNGPVPQGPFSTYAIAEHVIDRVLGNEVKVQNKSIVQIEKSNSGSSIGLFSLIGWVLAAKFLFDIFTK